MTIALELADDINEVLKDAGPSNGAVLGDVANHEDGQAT